MTCPEETELVVVGGEKRHSLMGIIWDHGEASWSLDFLSFPTRDEKKRL